MLEELRIRGLGVIDDAVARFGRGLTVVTGETGAGKTMVVTGLQLLFGGRAVTGRVRAGTALAEVDGVLRTPDASAAAVRVRDAGGEVDEGELLLRRTVSSAGRSRAYAGGTAVPVGVLADVGAEVLAVHGQADQMRLASPSEHRRALDRYAEIDLGDYRAAYEQWRAAEQALDERRRGAAALEREADLLAHGLREIESVDPQPGEDADLAARTTRLAHADALRLAGRAAHNALLGDADDPVSDAANVAGLLGTARRDLEHVAGSDPDLDELAVRLRDLTALAGELGADLAAHTAGLDADPLELERLEARRAELARVVRRYGQPEAEDPPGSDASVDLVLRWAGQARARLADVDTSEQAMAELSARRDVARSRAGDAAAALTAARTAAAARLGAAASAELAGLAMPSATLSVTVVPRAAAVGLAVLPGPDGTPAAAGPEGVDEVEFLLQPQPDVPPFGIHRGASGGELSRVMLALEVVLAGTDPVPVMVFDEVDAGVGGRAAIEIGRRLAQLAADHQVIVVTHLAQVAAFADTHLVVGQAGPRRGAGISSVEAVTGADRVTELARMLAGSDTATAREHAQELLADAARVAGRSGRGRAGPAAVSRSAAKAEGRAAGRSAAKAEGGTAGKSAANAEGGTAGRTAVKANGKAVGRTAAKPNGEAAVTADGKTAGKTTARTDDRATGTTATNSGRAPAKSGAKPVGGGSRP